MSDKEFTILIADDDKMNLTILYELLSIQYNVVTAQSGTDTIKRVLIDKPDLILLDIIMPGISGFDILLELKGMDTTKNIPVIFVTALDNAEDEEKGLFLGAVDYIKKPYVNAIVLARVRTHLQIVKQLKIIENELMLDYLVGIPNRRYFDKHIYSAWETAGVMKTDICLLIMDLDNFKRINDIYGHPHGDVVLQAVAQTTKDLLGNGEKVFRYGGEEFAVVLPDTNIYKGGVVAEAIRKAVEALDVLCLGKNTVTKVTISIGAATAAPWKGRQSVQGLITKADELLYESKHGGKNMVSYGEL